MAKYEAPLPYQKAGVRQIEAFGNRALLADDMGLGKTLQALEWVRRGRFTPVVVCPASVKYHWERTAAAQIGMRATVLEGKTPLPPGGLMRQRQHMTIINYSILPYWLRYLQALEPDCIIIDECHNIQNREANQTKAVLELARPLPAILAMSGTPLTNRPADLYTTVNLIRPDLFPSFLDYGWRYCRPYKRFGKWQYTGARNLPELNKILKEHLMIRRVKEDVLHELPQKVRRVEPMALRDYDEYNHVRDHFLEWVKAHGGIKKAKRVAKNEKLVQVNYLRQAAARLKIRNVAAWIDHFLENSDEKLVVFTVHVKMIEALCRRYAGRCVHVDGSVSAPNRQRAVDAFQSDPKCRLFFGNLMAASAGIDGLQRVCRTVAFAELGWRPGDHVQAEDRLNRMGQVWPVWAYYLVAHGTIEEKLCELLHEKQANIREVLDGNKEADEINLLDMLIDHLGNEYGVGA